MTHAQARQIIIRAWRRVHGRDPSESEILYTQAVAWLENQYGRAGQFAAFAANGQFNWGSLERRKTGETCPPGTVEGSDLGTVCFFVYPTDEEAAAAFIRNLTARHWPTIQAMRGSPEDVATAMRVRPAYYEGYSGSENQRIQTYANAIRNSIRAFGANIPSNQNSNSLFPWFLILGSAGAAFWWYKKKRR